MTAAGARPEPARRGEAARLAFVSDAVWPWNTGGKERRLWEITRRLAADGHDVHIYTMQWWEGRRSIRADGVHLHAIMKRRPLYHGERRSMLQAVLFGVATLKLLVVPFDSIDVDHMPFFPLFSARLIASLRRKRMSATWHEVWGGEYWRHYLGGSGAVAAVVEKMAARTPHQIIAVSDQTADRLRRVLAVTQPIHVIPNGVDFDTIDRTPESDLHPDVLFAGRLLVNKNVDLLIRAVAIVARTRRALHCFVIGAGPERAALMRLAGVLDVAGHVTFSDFLPGDEIYGVMKSAGVFVLPSVREGFGAVVLEANACGLPVVTVGHPDNAARHLIVEGANGYVVAVDPASIAAGILTALDRPPGLDPRRVMEERFGWLDWQAVTERVAAVLLGRPGPTPEPASESDLPVRTGPPVEVPA